MSILKPLLGVDKNLKANLQSFFTLKFPKVCLVGQLSDLLKEVHQSFLRFQFELLFCVKERHDPAVGIVKQLMDRYPAVEARIFYGGF